MIIGLVSAYSSTALFSLSQPNSTIYIEVDGPEVSKEAENCFLMV